MTLNECIDSSLLEWDKNPCLVEFSPGNGYRSIFASELRARIQETTKQFRSWGIGPKFLVPVFINNSIDYIIIFVSLMNLGALPVMAKLEYRKLELFDIFHNCRPQAVISEETHLPFLKPYLSEILVISRSGRHLRLLQSSRRRRRAIRVADDIATVNYTYRGYGYPIGVLVPHGQYLHGAEVLQLGLLGNPGEKMLVILPMSHIFTLVGCIVVPILFHMTAVIAQTIHPRAIFKCIRECSVEYITSVPQIYSLLLRLREHFAKLNSLRAFVSGGSLLTAEDYKNISQGFAVELLHGYGLTECTPVSRNIRGRAKAGTIGPVCEEIECRINTSSGKDNGEILIKSSHMSKTYLNRDWETRQVFEKDWFRTGDRGCFDGEHLIFLEEIKNTRKINGNIVDLEEVRKAILQDDQIAEVDIQYKNNALIAFCGVSEKLDFPSKVRELKNSLRGLVAEYKIPRTFNKMQ